MKFGNHKTLECGTSRVARSYSGKLMPAVVLHDAAGRLDHGKSADYLQTFSNGVFVQPVFEWLKVYFLLNGRMN